MTIFETDELIRFVRQHSPFYRDLYKDLPPGAKLTDLPVLDQEAYWKANTLENNGVLTGPMEDGVVFKSGGSTGNPKFSVFSKEEWKTFNEVFGREIGAGALKNGDRAVNLFYVGQLYGSFLFINKSFEESPAHVLQFPVAGSTDFEETARIIKDFDITVLAGVPTTIMNLAEYLESVNPGKAGPTIKTILFGGESMHPDQRERLGQVFKQAKIFSIGYASTDAGLLGFADTSCAPGEHRAFGRETIVEILDDDTHEPITEQGREGIIVVTNKTRKLMPIIRYPSGDRGKWQEAEGPRDRKFILLGRSEEAARIGLVKLYVQDVHDALASFKKELEIIDFQMVIDHHDKLDGLTVRISANKKSEALTKYTAKVIESIHKTRPLYEEFVRDSKVHPIQIAWVGRGGLEVNSRTGKLKRVIDKRF